MFKALNNGEIDKKEFQVLHELHLKVINKLSNVDRKMEAEMRTQLQKHLLEEISEIKKTPRKKIPHDLHTLSCLLSSVLPKLISSKIFTTNLIIYGKVRKPLRSCKSLARKNQHSTRNGCLDKLSGKCT